MAAKLKQYDFLFKLFLIGDSGVGKTCILERFCEDVFNLQLLTSGETVRVDIKLIVESLIISWYVSSRVVSHSLTHFTIYFTCK